MKRFTQKQKNFTILMFMILFLGLMTVGVVQIYLIETISLAGLRITQMVFYALLLGVTLLMMKISGYEFKYFGLFFYSLWWQLLISLGLAIAFTALNLFALGYITLPSDWIWLIPSQLLICFTEELFWRGLMIKLMRELMHSKAAAVVLNAFLFGCWHFLMSYNLITLILTSVIGLAFAVVRVQNEEQMGIPGLAFAHFLMNLF